MKKSRYKQEYAEMLVQHMKEGNSFESFGAMVRCSQDTLTNWTQKYVDFREAKSIGKSFEHMYWENLLKRGAIGDLPPIKKRVTVIGHDKEIKQVTVIDEPGKFNAASVIFALRAKFPKVWRDKQEVEITHRESIENLTDEEIKRRKELYASVVKKNG